MKPKSPLARTKLEILGKRCKEFRILAGYTLKEAAAECHTSISSIWQFEDGQNDSATMLMWYIEKGFSNANIG